MVPVQFRMARAGVRLRIEEVAKESKISAATIHRIEHDDDGSLKIRQGTLDKLARYFTGKGVLFVEGRVYGVLITAPDHHD